MSGWTVVHWPYVTEGPVDERDKVREPYLSREAAKRRVAYIRACGREATMVEE